MEVDDWKYGASLFSAQATSMLYHISLNGYIVNVYPALPKERRGNP